MKTFQIDNKKLVEFIKTCKAHLDSVDRIMDNAHSFERDRILSKEMNRFNFAFDYFLHSACNVPLKKLQSVLNENFTILKNDNNIRNTKIKNTTMPKLQK